MVNKPTGIPQAPPRRNQPTIHSRARSLADLSAVQEDVPASVGPSEIHNTPQEPRPGNQLSRSGNENLADTDTTCGRHVRPLDSRLDAIETSLPRLHTASEDSLARLSLVETNAAQISRIRDIENAISGLDDIKTAQAELKETLKGIVVPTVHTLQKDKNRVLEDSSETKRTTVAQHDLYQYGQSPAIEAKQDLLHEVERVVVTMTTPQLPPMKATTMTSTKGRRYDR